LRAINGSFYLMGIMIGYIAAQEERREVSRKVSQPL